MQLQAGAWGLTFANVHQLRVGLAAGAQRAIIQGAGHCCFIEKPDKFDAIVRDFLIEKGLWPA